MEESDSLQCIVQGYSSDTDSVNSGVVYYNSQDWGWDNPADSDGGDDGSIDMDCDDASQSSTVTKKRQNA